MPHVVVWNMMLYEMPYGMKCHDVVWNALIRYEYEMPRCGMKCHDMAWNAMRCHDTAWNAKKCHDWKWNAKVGHEMPWSDMIMQWCVVNYYKGVWNTMTCCDNAMIWHKMIVHNISWNNHMVKYRFYVKTRFFTWGSMKARFLSCDLLFYRFLAVMVYIYINR